MLSHWRTSEGRAGGFPAFRVLLLLLALGAVRGVTLGLPAIGGSSEAREAQVIDSIFRQGTWVLPLRNGIVPSKPPLFHWFGAICAHLVGGVSEWVVRLPSLVAGLVVLLCAAFVAYRLAMWRTGIAADRQRYAERATLLTVAVLALTYEFHQMTVQAMVDMVSAACMWVALAGLSSLDPALWNRERRISRGACALFWFGCACGVLARGPVGMVLPCALAITGGAYLVGLRTALMQLLQSWRWWLMGLLPVAWYLAAYRVGGEAFLERQLLFENVRRVTGGAFVNSEVWWFYLPSFLWQSFPWSVCALLFAWRDFGRLRAASGEAERRAVRGDLVPFVVAAFGIVLFSCASGKRHSYLVPIYPAVAIYIGCSLSALIGQGGVRVRYRLVAALASIQMVLTVAGLGAAVLLGLIVQGSVWMQSERVLKALGGREVLQLVRGACEEGSAWVVALLLASAIPGCLGMRTLRAQALGAWCSAILVATAFSSLGAHLKASFKGFPSMTRRILEHLQDEGGGELAVIKAPYDEYFDPILYYMHRPVTVIMDEFGPSDCRSGVLYLVHQEWLDSLPGKARGAFSRVAELREALERARGTAVRQLLLVRCEIWRGDAMPPAADQA